MTLDPRTIMFVTACRAPVLAMVLLSLRRNYPSSIRGLGWYTPATCCAKNDTPMQAGF